MPAPRPNNRAHGTKDDIRPTLPRDGQEGREPSGLGDLVIVEEGEVARPAQVERAVPRDRDVAGGPMGVAHRNRRLFRQRRDHRGRRRKRVV